MDPDAPGAGYEEMKRFFESGEWNITAETDWYMQRAFKGADVVFDCLRKRYWEISFTDSGRLIASDNPVLLEGDKGAMTGFKNANWVLYPLSRHAFLTGTYRISVGLIKIENIRLIGDCSRKTGFEHAGRSAYLASN